MNYLRELVYFYLESKKNKLGDLNEFYSFYDENTLINI